MPYDNDIECGEELARDIESGLISETDLTESGKRKLEKFRALPKPEILPDSTDEQLQFLGFKLPIDTTPSV